MYYNQFTYTYTAGQNVETSFKNYFRAFYVAKIIENSFTTWKIYKRTQPETIRNFHQFYLSSEEHNQKSWKFARKKVI